MRSIKTITLLLFTFLVLSPAISLTLKSAYAADSVEVADSTLTGAIDTSLLPEQPTTRPLVFTMTIEGAIGTVTDERIKLAINQAEDEGAVLLVIFLDTPGGFTKPTWAICKSILNSEVPVCMFIAPSGARAGSAGVYMTYSAHIAAMAPSTNIGAAHPVGGGGEKIDSLMNEKITNDAVAQIRAAAERRGRNAEWAEESVRESVAITDNEALELNVIDLRADNLDSLLAKLEGREIETVAGTKPLELTDARVKHLEISFVHRILDLITQPDIAFLLMSIGGLGIMLELYNPGAIFPGVVGSICLILAFYAFQTLPINYAGAALLLLSVLLFIAEIKIVSHGLLAIGGVISFFFGGIMLIDTVDPQLQISKSLLIGMSLVFGGGMASIVWLYIRTARRQPFIGNESVIGRTAEVRKDGFVFYEGALWKAESSDELIIGNKVEITEIDGLILKVKNI